MRITPRAVKVAEAMTRDVVTVSPQTPLKDAAEAHRALAAGETHGKVLLTVSG